MSEPREGWTGLLVLVVRIEPVQSIPSVLIGELSKSIFLVRFLNTNTQENYHIVRLENIKCIPEQDAKKWRTNYNCAICEGDRTWLERLQNT